MLGKGSGETFGRALGLASTPGGSPIDAGYRDSIVMLASITGRRGLANENPAPEPRRERAEPTKVYAATGLTGATSRGGIRVRRQGELKRGTVRCVCRGPQPATVGFYD